eukprot:CAMPEP_0175154998 /NCGR_PEP_ID=MMETSP0087-20121206/20702_1 /TAXON_ID=136419 /ORGANISM="Unknown Unknown, Strain D1" /LENGTH=232 /DNA_ID=CAMNT_0016442047 /DNA_START=30 /DNA_END=728 /DNA_ORIENTATION=+
MATFPDRLVTFGKQTGGCDKLIKFFASFTKFVAFELQARGNKELGGDFGRMASMASNSRKTFRCFKDVENYVALKQLFVSSKLPLLERLVAVAARSAYEIFIFFDHFLLAAKTKFLARDVERWEFISCWGWFWSCVGNAITALNELQKTNSTLQKQMQSEQSEHDAQAMAKLRKQQFHHTLSVVSNISDAVCAGIIIKYDKLLLRRKLSSWHYGLFGMISSACAVKQIWDKC